MGEESNSKSHIALLSILLENRKLGWAMFGGGMVYFALSLAGIHISSCPFKGVTGWDCPGCGLTSGTHAMLRGDWQGVFSHHWFTPVFMVFWAAVGFGLILPEPWRGKFLSGVIKSERTTHWPAILGILLVIYALTRNIIST